MRTEILLAAGAAMLAAAVPPTEKVKRNSLDFLYVVGNGNI